jgi:hypothetical protein
MSSTTTSNPNKHTRSGSYTDRDFALYDAIIVRNKDTAAATKSVDKKDLDDTVLYTWSDHGLPPVPKAFQKLEEPWEPNAPAASKKEEN